MNSTFKVDKLSIRVKQLTIKKKQLNRKIDDTDYQTRLSADGLSGLVQDKQACRGSLLLKIIFQRGNVNVFLGHTVVSFIRNHLVSDSFIRNLL